MKVQFTARHFKPTPDIRAHAIAIVERLEKFEGSILHAEVIIAEEKKTTRTVCNAEIILKAKDIVITTKASGAKHVEVIDAAAKKLERLLEKHKEKREHERTRKSKQTSARK